MFALVIHDPDKVGRYGELMKPARKMENLSNTKLKNNQAMSKSTCILGSLYPCAAVNWAFIGLLSISGGFTMPDNPA